MYKLFSKYIFVIYKYIILFFVSIRSLNYEELRYDIVSIKILLIFSF